MYTSNDEKEFLLSHITKDMDVLEYGSGESTIEIARLCNSLVSIEHAEEWFHNISSRIPKNVEYYLCRPDNENWENQFDQNKLLNDKGDDGDLMDFCTYVTKPLELNRQFDIVFIDGRARVACALVSRQLLKNRDCSVFIHDYGNTAKHPTRGYRDYYDVVNSFLVVQDSVGSMYRFKIK